MSVQLKVSFPDAVLRAIDQARGNETRTEFVRRLVSSVVLPGEVEDSPPQVPWPPLPANWQGNTTNERQDRAFPNPHYFP